MASLYTQQSKNVFRTWMLMTIFTIIVILIGFGADYYFESPIILYIAIVFALSTCLYSYWFSDRNAIRSAHAIPADPVQYRELHRIVENLAITAGLPKPRVYI